VGATLLVLGVGGGVLLGTGALKNDEDAVSDRTGGGDSEPDARRAGAGERSGATQGPDTSEEQTGGEQDPQQGGEPSTSNVAFEPYTPQNPAFAGYETEVPASFTRTENEATPGERLETIMIGPGGLRLTLDFTPLEPPGAPRESGGLTVEEAESDVDLGGTVADRYVFSGGTCPTARCVDYQVFLPAGGGVAVLGSGDDFEEVDRLARRVAGGIRESGG